MIPNAVELGLTGSRVAMARWQALFVCLFVCADGKEKQIKAATLAMQVFRSWDLAARPRTILLFFNPQNEGIGEGKTRKKHKAQTLALKLTKPRAVPFLTTLQTS